MSSQYWGEGGGGGGGGRVETGLPPARVLHGSRSTACASSVASAATRRLRGGADSIA